MNDINNWREEETLDLTSDISSHGSDNSGDGETSSATLMPQDMSVNSSAILEPKTPLSTALNHSGSSVPRGRLSISQPLLSTPSPSPGSNRLNMSAGNISLPPRPQRVPLVKTQEDNEALRKQVVELNAKLSVSNYQIMELERLLPREVKNILEEYYSLQNSRLDLLNEREELTALRRQLQIEANQAETNAQIKLENLNAKLRDYEKEKKSLQQQVEMQKERIAELESDLAKMEEIPTSLDALKGEDSDWTIRSECDIIANELRERLSAAEKENELLRRKIESQKKELDEKAATANDMASQSKLCYQIHLTFYVGQTFVIGGGCDAETLLQRIDDLEARLREEQEERSKASAALAAYMSRYHKLEKKLQEGNVSIGNSSFRVYNKEEARAAVEQLRDHLCHLGTENKELRRECTRLLKEKSMLSANSTGRSIGNETHGAKDVVAATSCIAEEHFEDKQMKLLHDLEDFIANNDGQESLIKAVTDVNNDLLHITDADFSSLSRGSPDRSDLRALNRESIAPENLSVMNASLVELMNLSLNTSKDIANFRERLGSFRGMMERIFETLRNSGLLLEEVLEKLGSESDEHKLLADKIRAMKFAWNTCLNETHNIMDAIDETDHCMNDVSLRLIAVEKSINEASFRMDLSVLHTSARFFTQPDALNRSNIDAAARCGHDASDFITQIASQKEEISNLQSLLGEAETARDAARSSYESLSKKFNEFEAEIAQISKERDELIAASKLNEAEKKELLVSLQEQKSALEQLKEDQSEIRQNAEALLREVADKDAAIIELEGKLMISKKSCEKLKEAILEREVDVNKLHEALEQEHQRKKVESSALRADLASAQETSLSLRRDVEKIRNEYNAKEATIRHLQEQLQTATENNARMAEVVCELQQASKEKEKISRKDNGSGATFVEVQAVPSIAKVKSREAQTDMTRTALAQMELDSVSYSSELKALHTAYKELATSIGELVVKDVSNILSSGDVSSVEKSCKELSRLIRHEKRRREQQALELAEVTDKVNDLHRKGALVETAQNDVSRAVSSDPPNYSPPQKRYEIPMRQKLYVLTRMAMDLVNELRRLSGLNASGHGVDFKNVIEQARSLRNELNERFVIVRSEKENMNSYHLSDLINMVELLSKDNRTLHESLNRCKIEYENLEKKNANNPELAKKIAAQLRNIHAVMGESKRACELLQEATNKASNRAKVTDPRD